MTEKTGKVIVDMSISLDGYIADAEGGDGGLNAWVFGGDFPVTVGEITFQLTSKASAEVFQTYKQTIGAFVMGKRTFEASGGDAPFGLPTFVLTHTPSASVRRGDATITFITEGIEDALQQAQAIAGEQDVYIFGGAETAQQYIQAGLVDKIHINLVPIFFGEGKRLFTRINPAIKLECHEVIEGVGVTHLRYRMKQDHEANT